MVQTTPLKLSWHKVGSTAATLYLPQPTQSTYPVFWLALIEHLTTNGCELVDHIPAYCSLFIDCKTEASLANAIKLARDFVRQYDVETSAHDQSQEPDDQTADLLIPVCYHQDFAPDLPVVAAQHDLTHQQVIKAHTAPTYLVYALGFIPGFAFLGYVDDHIATPRRQTPRAEVCAGSVGIAGRQTGVYPAQSPGGWQIIGRTPMTLFDPDNEIYGLFDIASRVRFYEISLDEFHHWEQS